MYSLTSSSVRGNLVKRASLRLESVGRASLCRNQADRACLGHESMGRASLRRKRLNGLVFVAI